MLALLKQVSRPCYFSVDSDRYLTYFPLASLYVWAIYAGFSVTYNLASIGIRLATFLSFISRF